MQNLSFQKTGIEVKQAITAMQLQLRDRLNTRNAILEAFLDNRLKVRSYLIRTAASRGYGHGMGSAVTLFSKDDISSEEMESIEQLCKRIYEIEQEINQLTVVANNLKDDQELNLALEDLLRFGFSGFDDIQAE